MSVLWTRPRKLPRPDRRSHVDHRMVFLGEPGLRERGAAAPLLYPRPVSEPLNVFDYEALAASRLGPGAHAYYTGGANDELTLRENVEAYRRWHLRPRVLRDVASPTSATTVLGRDVSLPVLVAPVAYQRAPHPDGELGMARGSRAAGTIMYLS